MIKKRKPPTGSQGGGVPSAHAEQGNLWLEPYVHHSHARTPASSTPQPAITTLTKPQSQQSTEIKNGQRTLQDLLFTEGLLAARLAVNLDSLEVLHSQLIHHLHQNSLETRSRYARSILKWFFPNGVGSLVRNVWAAYNDESITADILRYFYLVSEPIMGACIAEALYPLEEGMLIPAHYFDRFLRDHLDGEPPPKTRRRLKTNLMKLGFLARARGKPDRLQPVIPTHTAFLILLHHLFAPNGPRTVELRRLLANPFWQYLGFKSEDTVRAVLRVERVLLFGSYARGAEREGSDIDVLIVSSDFSALNTRERLEYLGTAAARLWQPIEALACTPDELAHAEPATLLEEIARTGVRVA